MKKPSRREDSSTPPRRAPAENREEHTLPSDASVENEDARLYRRTDMLGPLPIEELERMDSDPDRRSDVQNLSPLGLAADPYGEGLNSIPYEEEPDAPEDILPDQIRRMPGAEDDDDRELTARPRESVRPIMSDELPEG